MKRAIVFSYKIVAYVMLISVVIYGVCFMGNLWLSQSIDANPQMPLVPALLIDGSLAFLYAVWRSGRNNQGFKRYWNKLVPASIERITNIFLTSALIGIILWGWQPIGRVVWEISNQTVIIILRGIYLSGWIIIFVGFLLNSRKDLFGLKQSWSSFRNRPFRKNTLRSFVLYKLVRDPIYLGMLICLWSAPTMTVSHLFFAMLMTLYVITLFQLEEKNLTINYRDDQRRRRAF